MNSSLRRQLLVWVLFPLMGAVAVDTWLTYRSAFDTASVVQDRLLIGSARMIAEQVTFEDGTFQHQIPPAALELFQSEDVDRIFYRVTTGNGQLLSGYSDLQVPPLDFSAPSPYFFFTTMRGSAVRVVVVFQPVIGAPSAAPVVVEVAQTTNAQTRLTNKLWQQAVQPQLLLLALVAVLIVFGLQRGLRPVRALRNSVNAREPGTLQPLIVQGVPNELIPLVDSLNDYIRRLEEHVGAQSLFIQNAAHQLRTPFAVLNTQLSFAARATEEEGRAESLAAARRTLRQASRLVNQLLTLSSADALVSQGARGTSASSNLASIVQEVFESLAGQAHTKLIDLGFEMVGEPPHLAVRAVVLREMLMNLVDNAVRYSPAGSRVTVRVAEVDGAVHLEVEDNGPGIPADSRERVLERFYRLNDSESDGSGLGLAIVREFATKAGATISLSTPASGQGLLVALAFGPTRPGAG
jgi:two-component system sensor histidine kinase TctE